VTLDAAGGDGEDRGHLILSTGKGNKKKQQKKSKGTQSVCKKRKVIRATEGEKGK